MSRSRSAGQHPPGVPVALGGKHPPDERDPIETIRKEFGVGKPTAKQLVALGYDSLQKFKNLHVATLLDRGVSWGITKRIVSNLTARGMSVVFETPDESWNEDRWKALVTKLVDGGLLTWRQAASAILGAMNPPQVGTAIASDKEKNFQRRYGKGTTLKVVMNWLYSQSGACANCGARIHLEADHIKSKQEYRDRGEDPSEADRIENLQLLCKRCNVIKRESHELGGLSFETAEAALMWILLEKRPKTLAEFEKICRRYGLTMSTIRFSEAWAMAIWLSRIGKYSIDRTENTLDVVVEEAEAEEAEGGEPGSGDE